MDEFEVTTLKKQVKIDILKELREMSFPNIVKIRATEMFDKYYSSKTHRGQKRLTLILGCVYDSFREYNIVHDIHDLAKKIGLQDKLVGSSIKFLRISQASAKEVPSTITRYLTPLDIIPEIMETHGFLVNIDDVKLLYNRLLQNSNMLQSSKPQSVAYALVYYYLTVIGGNEIDLEVFCKGNSPCLMTVKKLVDEIIFIER